MKKKFSPFHHIVFVAWLSCLLSLLLLRPCFYFIGDRFCTRSPLLNAVRSIWVEIGDTLPSYIALGMLFVVPQIIVLWRLSKHFSTYPKAIYRGIVAILIVWPLLFIAITLPSYNLYNIPYGTDFTSVADVTWITEPANTYESYFKELRKRSLRQRQACPYNLLGWSDEDFYYQASCRWGSLYKFTPTAGVQPVSSIPDELQGDRLLVADEPSEFFEGKFARLNMGWERFTIGTYHDVIKIGEDEPDILVVQTQSRNQTVFDLHFIEATSDK